VASLPLDFRERGRDLAQATRERGRAASFFEAAFGRLFYREITPTPAEETCGSRDFSSGAPPKVASLKKAAISVGASGIDGRTADRLKRGLLEPQARLDLHGLDERSPIER